MGVDAERECWELRSGAGVGPLQFGMSPAEVAQASLVPGQQERAGGPYAREDFPDGVKAFHDAGKLACVALDAVTGPQVFLVPHQATFAPSRRPARTLGAPGTSPRTSRTRTCARHAESTHRTPLLDRQTLPAAAPARPPHGRALALRRS
ncbi:hypothetical protein GCM10027075_39090 [Streptomyces heilongjiangensis]